MRQTGYQPIGIHLSSLLANRNKDYGWRCSRHILNVHRTNKNMHGASFKRIEMKKIIQMILKPNHNNFTGIYKIEKRINLKNINISTFKPLILLPDDSKIKSLSLSGFFYEGPFHKKCLIIL
jgi:hypothetical protein